MSIGMVFGSSKRLRWTAARLTIAAGLLVFAPVGALRASQAQDALHGAGSLGASASQATTTPVMLQKDVPAEIRNELQSWKRQAQVLRVGHALLAVIAVISSVMVASRLFAAHSHLVSWLAVVSALAVGILSAMNLEQKSNNMMNAWRHMNAAVLRFQNESSYDTEKLIQAYEDSEKIIGDVKLSTSRE